MLFGGISTTPTSNAWPSANLALFVPFVVSEPLIAYKIAVGCGTTASGNFDVGIYDRFGNRMVSSGATAKTASTEVVCNITDTQLGPGLYYAAMAADGANNYIMIAPSGASPVPLQKCKGMGCLEMASAYTLPDPATFAAYSTGTLIPAMSILLRSY